MIIVRTKSADDLRAAHLRGESVKHIVEAGATYWCAVVDELGAKATARAQQGKSLLASESRDLQRARKQAGEFALLLDDMQPVHRLDPEQRFPHQ